MNRIVPVSCKTPFPAHAFLDGFCPMHPDGICCESQETGKRKPNAAKQQSLDFFQSCLQDMAAFCRAPVFHHSKIKTIPTRECRKCHSKIDPRSKDCPICGDYTSDQSIVIPNVRPLGKCSTCQAVCYERCCSICGEKIQADWGSACNEREPLTWTTTPLRVRTPTGSPPPAPRVVALPCLQRQSTCGSKPPRISSPTPCSMPPPPPRACAATA